jgi:hypothetical protein
MMTMFAAGATQVSRAKQSRIDFMVINEHPKNALA